MEVIKIDINDMVATPELKEAVAKIGFDEYESRFNQIFNDNELESEFRATLSEQMSDAMDDWKVVIINGAKSHAWQEEMALAKFPEQPIFTNCINGEPYIYIDMSMMPNIPADIRDVTLDYMLVKEGVHREQIIRGDMVIFDGTITWKGVTYTVDQIHEMASEKTMELLNSDAEDNQYDEKDIMVLVDCQHEWEREATVRTLAGLSHIYEMELSDVQRKLVDDWVKEFIDDVNAHAGDDGIELESPVMNFGAGTKVADIKDWVNTLFMCDVDNM
ncbi:hypothetical protein pVa21_099 [Vibrio phage pVa-21]|nr:hypothetical protein pVa21_099 [Vibrio phage pVa-21]